MGLTLYLVYNILSPLLFLAYLPALILSPKHKFSSLFSDFTERFSLKAPDFPQPPIWFHASSVGEVKSLAKIISIIKQKKPETPVLITTSTVTGRAEAFKLTEYAILMKADFLPLVKRFIKTVKPAKLIIAETELWPNLIRVAADKTETLIINGRISAKSAKRYKLVKPLIRFMLKDVKRIMAQSTADAERFSVFCDSEKVYSTGNIKYDVLDGSTEGREVVIKTAEKYGLNLSKAAVFGSTHPVEEKIISKAVKLLSPELPSLNFIFVPRHLSRVQETESIFKAQGLEYIKWSEINAGKGPSGKKVLIVDEMGLLISFYSLSLLSFVGGTLDETGGHNLLEPAQFSKPIIFGPNYANAKEAGEKLLSFKGGFVVRDEYDLKARMKILISDPRILKEAGANSLKALVSLQGATGKIIKEIL